MPEISIILPTYHPDLGKLSRMIRCVCNQTLRDFELIIVEDGNSSEIHEAIKKMASADERIRLVWQENAGVSAARNKGISSAAGNYIAFVDDDDILSPYFLEESLKALVENNCDFVIGGIVRVHGSTDREKDFARTEYTVKVLEGKELSAFQYDFLEVSERFLNRAYFGRGPYAKLIRKSSCNVLFQENMSIGEDQIYNLDVLNQINRLALVYRIWYIYIVSPNSATEKCSPLAREKIERLLKEVSARLELDSPKARLFWKKYLASGITTITSRWYGHKDCPLTRVERVRELRELSRKEPWIAMFDKRDQLDPGKKFKLIAVLFRTGLLSIAWECAIVLKNSWGKFSRKS